jgi:hypothetical protein
MWAVSLFWRSALELSGMANAALILVGASVTMLESLT